MKNGVIILAIFLGLVFSFLAIPSFGFENILYPDGALLRAKDDIKVWVIKNGQKRWIESPEIFNSLGYKWNDIISVEQTELDFYPEREFELRKEPESQLPESFTLDIPFICQAPLANWKPPFDQACEEAAVLTIDYYFQQKVVKPDIAAKEIQEIVNFETKNYNFGTSISAEQTAQLIRDYFGYKAEVRYDISLDDIKRELVKGNSVIAPAAGRMLGNPYFTPPGPVYHMLVIKGYTPDKFIVSDPGTRRGANFTYSYQVLEKAIHDWNNGDVKNGKPAMILIQK